MTRVKLPAYDMTIRVQIPVYTDRWAMGDRYGDIVKVTKARIDLGGGNFGIREIAHVKLDKSGKTVKVIYVDCTEV